MERILIITASPRNRPPLCLDEEVRGIRERLRASPRNTDLELHYYGAAQYPDIEQAVRTLRPRFVHFAGYDSPEHGPLLEDEKRGPRGVSAEVFAEIFQAQDGWVECLFFSTCFVGRHAEVLAKHVRHVVGMTEQVSDKLCVRFAAEFYGAVFEGLAIADAFESARRTLSVEGLDVSAPVLFSNPRFLNALPAIENARPGIGGDAKDRKRILILSANPTGGHQLEIDTEVRSIRAGLHAAGRGPQFYILHCPAVRPADIIREILAFRPEIVHFAGHGRGAEDGLAVAVKDSAGGYQFLKSTILTTFFKCLVGSVKCVLWNSCHSAKLASQTSAYVTYAIGHDAVVSDEAAIQFAVEFYAAHGGGASIESSFELSVAQLEAMEMEEAASVRLFVGAMSEKGYESSDTRQPKLTLVQPRVTGDNSTITAGTRGLQATKQGTESEKGGLLTKREVRLAMDRLIPTDAELDAFLIDYFPAIKSLLSDGMDRIRKHNILLESVELDNIVAALRNAYPDKM